LAMAWTWSCNACSCSGVMVVLGYQPSYFRYFARLLQK